MGEIKSQKLSETYSYLVKIHKSRKSEFVVEYNNSKKKAYGTVTSFPKAIYQAKNRVILTALFSSKTYLFETENNHAVSRIPDNL